MGCKYALAPPIFLEDLNGRSSEAPFLRIPTEQVETKNLADNGNK